MNSNFQALFKENYHFSRQIEKSSTFQDRIQIQALFKVCGNHVTIIGSDNGLSPGRRQAIIRTNAGILFIRPLGTNFSEILSKIHSFSFKKMHLKMSFAKWLLFHLRLNELTHGIFLH